MKLYSDYGSTGIHFGGSTGLVLAGPFIAALTPLHCVSARIGETTHTVKWGREKECFVLFSVESVPQAISQHDSTHAGDGPEQQAALKRGKSEGLLVTS